MHFSNFMLDSQNTQKMHVTSSTDFLECLNKILFINLLLHFTIIHFFILPKNILASYYY